MPKESYYLPQRRLVSQDDAAIIERADVPRSKFIGSKTRKTSFDAGYLVPFFVDEILPGDHMTYDVTAYVRMSTPLFPLFDNQRVDTFFFYVPSRILWSHWVHFMGQQDAPTDSIAYTVPTVQLDNLTATVGSLYDHFGIPVAAVLGSTIEVNSLPLRAYNLIYNTWFRDQNLTTPAPFTTADGPDTVTWYALKKRAKSHDYFTSALPWPQKFTAPTIPVGGNAPIKGIGFEPLGTPASVANANVVEYGGAAALYATAIPTAESTAYVYLRQSAVGGGSPDIYADLSAATGVSISTFRNAWMVQSLLERDARGGTRYVELIRSHFGVTNPDFRLQRPEYIGGGQSPLAITPIAQTAPSTGVPVGALGAAGTSAGQHRASYAATEHGYVIGLINVRSELSYQNGLHRMWKRSTRYEFYWPALAGLGEQAILRQEIFCNGLDANDSVVFGYQESWHEYRTMYSDVTGIMRSDAPSTLDAWHLAQRFTVAPTLNTAFIEDTPPMDRVLAAAALAQGQQYLADIMISRTAVRPLPTFGTPATLGRF